MEVDWNVVTGEIITAVLKILIPVCVALVLKWAGEFWTKLKEQKPDLAEVLSFAARTAVYAAEQLFPGKGQGEEKKAYAIEAVERYLYERGFAIDVHVIEDAIEATVFSALNSWKYPDGKMQAAEEDPAPEEKEGSEMEDPEKEPEQ
jgi:Phage holin protein (Holin_LLH).